MIADGLILLIYICIYSSLVTLFVGYLFFYHFYLIYYNLTTKEQIRQTYNNLIGNPFKT